jgi:hypothetical protein
MFIRTILKVIILSLCLVPVSNAENWYSAPDKGQQGFYGYEPEEEIEEEQKEKKISINISPSIPVKKNKPTSPKTIEEWNWPSFGEMMTMKPAQFKEAMKKASDEAIASPSYSNVKRWISYVSAGRQKSHNFSQAHAWVLSQNPEFAYHEFTNVKPGNQAMQKERIMAIENYLHEKSENYGLFVFLKKESLLNSPLERIVSNFQKNYNWQIKFIDVDNEPDLATAMGVSMVPQIIVVARNNEISPFIVATGMISGTDLKKGVFRGLRVAKGEVEPTEYATNIKSVPSIKQNQQSELLPVQKLYKNSR